MTSQAELRRLVGRVRRRMILSRGMVLLGVGSGISAGAVVLMEREMYAVLALLPVALLWMQDFRHRSVAKVIDKRCDTNGALECAWDNLHRDTPAVIAQRKQGLSMVMNRPLAGLAPYPNRAWLTPMAALGIALLVNQADPFEEGISVEGSEIVRPATETAQKSAEVTPNLNPAAQSSTVQESRASVTKPESQSKTTFEEKVDKSQADRGRGTGKGLSGATGRRMVVLDAVSPRVKGGIMDENQTEQIAVPTRWKTKNADDGIAQPAQPYPSQYRSVISEWFDRKGGR